MDKKDNMPLISVIVPVYKVEKYIHRCVDSILGQTFRDFELLLIDDGSPDCCPEICDEYAKKDSRVRVFHQENKGVGAARNLGLLNVRGGYLTFVDSDDYVDDCMLSSFNEYIDGGYDWIVQGLRQVDENGSVINIVASEKNIIAMTRQNFDDVIGNIPWLSAPYCKLFKTSIIEANNIKFITTSTIGEDRLFNIMYSQFVTTIAILQNVIYTGTINSNSITHQKYISLPDFLNVSNAMDNLIGEGKLGSKMTQYTARFCARLYVRAIGSTLVYPSKALPINSRVQILFEGICSLLCSNTLRRFPVKTLNWMIPYVKYCVKKVLRR